MRKILLLFFTSLSLTGCIQVNLNVPDDSTALESTSTVDESINVKQQNSQKNTDDNEDLWKRVEKLQKDTQDEIRQNREYRENLNEPPFETEMADGHSIWTMPVRRRADYLDTFYIIDIDNSTAIDRIGYSGVYGDLYIRFLESQKEYAYKDVERTVYYDFLDAESIGGYYNANIKGQYDCIRLFSD